MTSSALTKPEHGVSLSLEASPSISRAFDYGTIASELATTLRTDADRIRRRIAKFTADMIEIGRDLNAVKGELLHGQFIDWVEAEIGIHRRTAQRYMAAADLADAKGDTVSLLTRRAVYLLSKKSTPAEIIDHVIERFEAEGRISDEAVESLVRGANVQRKQVLRDDRMDQGIEPPSVAVGAEPGDIKPGRDRAEAEENAAATAQTLFAKLGADLVGIVLDALRHDAQSILDKLDELLTNDASGSSPRKQGTNDRPPAPAPSVALGGASASDANWPEVPPSLDRRIRDREGT
jgi:hypothetical protein